MDGLLWVAVVGLYLAVGRLIYLRRWPEGLLPSDEDDDVLDRVRRVGRRRVLPVPSREGRAER